MLLQLGKLADFICDKSIWRRLRILPLLNGRSLLYGLLNGRSLLYGLLHGRSLLRGLLNRLLRLSGFCPVNSFVNAFFSAVDQCFAQVAERVPQLRSRVFPRVFQI